MKISNFKLTKTTGQYFHERRYFATVDVTTTTGFAFWKKSTTTTREVQREYGSHWFFVDTGGFTPDYDIEALTRSWTAKTGQEC